MRAERRLPKAAAAAPTAALLGARCTAEREPVRVGVLLECTGLLVGSRDSVLAAASLPLLEHGGRRTPELVTGSAGGRRIELVPTCTESTYPHKVIFAHASTGRGRRCRRGRRPDRRRRRTSCSATSRDGFRTVTFLASDMGAQETTLRDPPPNVLPLRPDRRADDGGTRDLTRTAISAGVVRWSSPRTGIRDGRARRASSQSSALWAGTWSNATGTHCSAPIRERRLSRHAAEADGVLLIATSGYQVP